MRFFVRDEVENVVRRPTNRFACKAGMVTRRGNLNYQDCRRVLVDGEGQKIRWLDDEAR